MFRKKPAAPAPAKVAVPAKAPVPAKAVPAKAVAADGADEDIDVEAVHASLLAGDGDEDHEEAHSSVDENDPELNAALGELVDGGDDDGDGGDDGEGGNRPESSEARLKRLRLELREESEAMLMFKKEGCDDEAQELMPRINELRAQVAALEAELRKFDPQLLVDANARRDEYRKAASAWLKSGNKEAAKKWLGAAKALEEPIATMERGEAAPGFVVPAPAELPSAAPEPAPVAAAAAAPATRPAPKPLAEHATPKAQPAKTATSAPAAAPKTPVAAAKPRADELMDGWTNLGGSKDGTPVSVNGPRVNPALEKLRMARAKREAERQSHWQALTDALRDEVKHCNDAAKELRDTDKRNAVEYLRRRKEAMALLERAGPLQASGAPAPTWDKSAVLELHRAAINEDVGDLVMAVEVVRGLDMVGEHGELLNAFVKVLYSYHAEATATDDTVFTSPSKTGNRALDWKWTQLLPITRKKSFQKWLEGKKLKVELWDIRGMFRSQHLLGRVEVSLEGLLKQCTVTGVYPVMNVRKKVGPSLEVTVKLRVPLLGAAEEITREPCVNVLLWPAEGPTDEDKRAHAEEQRLVQEHQQQQQQKAAAEGPARAPAVPARASSAAEAVTGDPFAHKWSVAEAAADPANPARFVSLAVLDGMAAQFTALGVEKQHDAAALEAANTALRRVHMRSFAITAWIKEGHCSKAEYCKLLERAIAEETSLASHFKTAQNKTEALNCLKRVKVMKAELETGAAPAEETPAAAPAAAPAVPARPTPAAAKAAPAAPPVVAAAKPSLRQSAKTSTGHRSVDLICSVAVLDWELGLCAADKEGDPDEVENRKMELELKKKLMMMSIESGQVDVEDYAAALKQCITGDKALAKTFLAAGNRKEATYCLSRAKVMEKELEG